MDLSSANDQRKRLERSATIERLERFERVRFLLLPICLVPVAYFDCLLPNACLRSNLVSSLQFLHIATLEHLFEDALIQKILDVVFRDLGITHSNDFLYSS